MNKYLLFLVLLLCFQSTVHAERVTGPADLRDKPDGKIIVSLLNDADVDCIAVKDDWYIVSVEVFLSKTDVIGKDRINNKAILYDSKNSKIGTTMDIVAIDRSSGIREGKERSSANVVAYLHKKYIKKITSNPLIIEEYKLPAKNIHDLPRKNKCTDLADCLPAEILKKRKERRAIAPNFQQDQLDNKTLGVGRVTPTTAKNIRKDLGVPLLTLEIQLGDRPLYSFETIEGTSYREIQQLYAYNGHWILEYKQKDASDKQCTVYSGSVMMDGANLTAQYNYQEMFNYGYIKDKPFYFFRSSTKFGGISYAGVVLPLDYDEIPHFLCCADSGFNPRDYKDMTGFFAIKNGALYYVEAGVYE
ncbi:MAG: hypothetical protein M0R70_01620 [Nitrospirae bacterium]|nr:hypothetical protein [Nitrospirota bacterium]